jgi:hypothetical protein
MAYQITRKTDLRWEIHTPGCKDIKRRKSWVEQRDTVRQLVEDEHAHELDEYPYAELRKNFVVMPCAKGIPEE